MPQYPFYVWIKLIPNPKVQICTEKFRETGDNVCAAFCQIYFGICLCSGKRKDFFWKRCIMGSFSYRVKQTTSAAIRDIVQGWIVRKLSSLAHEMTVKLKDYRGFTWLLMELTGSAGPGWGLNDNEYSLAVIHMQMIRGGVFNGSFMEQNDA